MRVLAPEDLEGVDEERDVLARLEDADEEQVAPGEAVPRAHPPPSLRVGVGGEGRAGGERHRHHLVWGDGEALEDFAPRVLGVRHHEPRRPQGAGDQHAKEQPVLPRDGPGQRSGMRSCTVATSGQPAKAGSSKFDVPWKRSSRRARQAPGSAPKVQR